MNLLSILLMGQPNTPPGGEQKGGGYTSILFLLVLIVVFYLFFIRPQVKKSKDQRNFQEGISKGDKVITVGGIHGKVVEVHETAVTIDTGNGNKLKVEKSAISMENSTPSQSGRK